MNTLNNLQPWQKQIVEALLSADTPLTASGIWTVQRLAQREQMNRRIEAWQAIYREQAK